MNILELIVWVIVTAIIIDLTIVSLLHMIEGFVNHFKGKKTSENVVMTIGGMSILSFCIFGLLTIVQFIVGIYVFILP